MKYYDRADADDKAVHYYSSAFFCAPACKRSLIRESIPIWLEKIDTRSSKSSSDRLKQRLFTRLLGPPNYTVADILIKFIRTQLLRASAPGIKNVPYSKCVKTSFLLMLIIAMSYLIFLSFKSFFGIWPMLLIFNLASFHFLSLFKIVPPPLSNMDTFRAYAPRGSATLFILAILLSYAADRKTFFVFSCLLLLGWHAGLAISVFVIVSVMFFAINTIAYLFVKKENEAKALSRPFYFFFTFLLLFCCLICARKIFYDMPTEAIALNNLPFVSSSKEIIYIGVLIGMLFFMKTKIIDCQNWYCLKFLLGIIGFLIVSRICSFFLYYLPVDFLIRVTKLHLINELPERLSGAQYLLNVTLFIFILWCIGQKYKRIFLTQQKILQRTKLSCFLFLAIILLSTAHHNKEMYRLIYRQEANYFLDDYGNFEKVPLEKNTLCEMDPANETQFFYSLGEFIFGDNCTPL